MSELTSGWFRTRRRGYRGRWLAVGCSLCGASIQPVWTLYSPHGLFVCCWAHAPDSHPPPTYSLTKLLPLCGAVAGCGCTTCRYSCHIFLTLCYSRNLHRTDQVRNISTIFPPLAFTPCCVSTALHMFCLGSVSTCYQSANLAIRRERVYLSTHPAACTEHADESGSGWIHAGEWWKESCVSWSVHGETGPQQVLLVTHVGGRAGPGPVPRSGYTTLSGRFMSSWLMDSEFLHVWVSALLSTCR